MCQRERQRYALHQKAGLDAKKSAPTVQSTRRIHLWALPLGHTLRSALRCPRRAFPFAAGTQFVGLQLAVPTCLHSAAHSRNTSPAKSTLSECLHVSVMIRPARGRFLKTARRSHRKIVHSFCILVHRSFNCHAPEDMSSASEYCRNTLG